MCQNAYVVLHIFAFWTPHFLSWTIHFGWTPCLNYTLDDTGQLGPVLNLLTIPIDYIGYL